MWSQMGVGPMGGSMGTPGHIFFPARAEGQYGGEEWVFEEECPELDGGLVTGGEEIPIEEDSTMKEQNNKNWLES